MHASKGGRKATFPARQWLPLFWIQAGLSLRGLPRGGKSGQCRASHHLIRGFRSSPETDRVTENNRPGVTRGKGENVR